MKRNILLIITLFVSLYSFAQTFGKSTNKTIPDVATLQDTLTVSGLGTSINSAFGIQDIMINISHPNASEISAWIISPNGTIIELTQNNGWGGANYINTHFNYIAGSSAIYLNTAPFNGNFQPQEWLGTLNNGQNPNGRWILKVNDCCLSNIGSLLNWSITFSTYPAPIMQDTTHLPIIEVFTNGKDIVDEPKIMAQMKIIDNGNGKLNHYSDTPVFNGIIGIEYRGSSSQSFPQKPYAVETWDSLGNNVDTSILGFPTQHDWIFYPPYDDKSLLRNTVIYNISNQMGHYATRTRYFILYINGMYEGIYVFMEKIKRDKNRVNIANLKAIDTSGVNLTGGYIIKIDKSTGAQNLGFTGTSMLCDTASNRSESIYYLYDYPSPDSLQHQQAAYIVNFMRQFEYAFLHYSLYDTVNGYKKYVSLKTFVDHSMMVEFARNIDGYRLSSYYHKDKDSKDPHLKAGPIWDYNLSFGNGNYGWAQNWNVWQWNLVCPGNPVWWDRMYYNDTVYRNEYKCRYTSFRQNVLSWNNINSLIDSLRNIVQQDQVNTYKRWPILGYYTWPNAYWPPTFQQEIDTLKSWIQHRLIWMDSQLWDSTCIAQSLPVNIFSFNGRLIDDNVVLRWQVGNEINMNKYVVERSLDGVEFEDIADIIAAGKITYSYKDDIQKWKGNNIYYRLKLIDINGVYTYSKIFVIRLPLLNGGFTIVPNPAKDYVQLMINNCINKTAIIQIADITGRLVLKQELPIINGVVKINTGVLHTGTYLLKMILKGESYSEKLLILK